MIFSGLIVGGLLGFVMQRTRFCLTGGFRDMYVQKNNKMFYALLIAITIQSIGLLILRQQVFYKFLHIVFQYWEQL